MATKLKNMKLTSVDLVRAGANQEADIGLFKSAGPQAEYDEALVKSARSILEDPDLAEDQQAGMLAKSVDDYRAALEEPEDEPEDEPDGEEVMVEKEPEEEEPADLDEIEEVEKYNHNHAADGKFTFSGGGSSGGGGGSHGSKVQWHTQGHDWWPDKTKRPSKKPEGRIEYHLAPKKPKDSGRRKDPWNDMKFNVPTPRPGAHDGSTGPRWDPKEDERRVFLPGGGKTKKSAFTSGDQYDMITEVRKFNPFHDALGRFASKNGFKTYSANPKMKAAQPSIIRSAQAGHGHTMNVHAESKGENIGQNYDWMLTGKKPAGVVSTPPKPQKPKTQKPKPQPKTDPAEKPKGDHKMVEGKDISESFKYDKASPDNAVEQVAKQQGYKEPPRVVSKEEFDAAVEATGIIGFRTVHDDYDVKTGNHLTSKEFAEKTIYDSAEDYSFNGTGGKAFGYGMYVAINSNAKPGVRPGMSPGENGAYARADSECYGYGVDDSLMSFTVDPSAKIISASDAHKAYKDYANSHNLTSKQMEAKFGPYDHWKPPNAFVATLGYDAVLNENAGCSCDYLVVLNRSKLIALEDIEAL